MANPTAGDVHVNRPLTNILIAFTQDAKHFVASRVFPNIPVQKQSDSYFTYERKDWFRSEITRERAASTESEGSGWRVDASNTYYARVYAIHKDIDDQLRANADQPIDLDRDATLYVGDQLMLKKELIFVTKYLSTGLWTGASGGTDLTGVAAAPGANQFLQWNDAASNPIEDITAQIVAIHEKTGRKPNKLILGAKTWYSGLKNHPDLLDRIKYTQRGVVTTELLAALLELDEVLVSGAVQNTAVEGATASYSFVFSKAALLVYANPSPSIMQPSGGYTFSWNGYLGAGGLGERVKRFRVDPLNSDRVEGEMAFDMKLIASELGAFFTAAVA